MLIKFLFPLLLLSSCSYFRKPKTETPDAIARAYDKFLSAAELHGIVPKGSTAEDSISITKSYIYNWMHQQTVIHLAEENLDAEKKNVEQQLQEYRNSLIRYAYETELVRQKLDTIVADSTIERFYKDNPANFQLKSNIIKVVYLKLNKKTPKLDKVREWYKSDNPKDKKLLEDYCHQYAINYYLDDQTWLLFDDLVKEIPLKTYDQEQFLQNNRNVEIQDSTSLYLVSIEGFKIKNSLSPLSFERNNILSMIINQRKLKLIENMEQQAFADAEKKGDVEILKTTK